MKVTCESCGSKYTIKDEKVRGKRVKIRCKGCKSPIVVDGTALDGSGLPSEDSEASDQPNSLAPEADSTEAAEGASAASPEWAAGAATAPGALSGERWSVNLSETDSRDMTVDEIVAAWGSLVTDDAYVYKPGFEDWKPILEVPELAARLGGPPGTAPDAFSPPAGPSPFAAGRAAASTRSGDLFGSVATAGSEDDPGIGLPGAAPATGSVKPTGARNESSVLFSLDALKAGFESSAPKPATAPSADDPFGLGASAGFGALGGGFDQNQALLTAPPPEPKKPKKVASLAPGADAEPGLDRNKWLMIGAGVLVLLVAVGGVGYALGGGGSDDTEQVSQGEGIEKEPAAEARASKTREGKAGTSADESEDKSAKGEGEGEAKAEGEPEEKKAEADEAKADDAKTDEAKDDAKSGTAKPAGGAVAGAAKPDTKKDDKPKAAAKPAADTSGAPPFNKSAAISALSSAAGSAASCKIPGGPTGSGKAIVTFAPSGRVTTANVVGGKFGGTSVGGCVASRFRGARVPAFSGGPVTVSKSFTIK